uniref:Uncharacterized protein n=1 Tax=Arundo donax TaxID=35708 RepID=A0A0A9BRH1_ARUDO
MKLRWWNFIYFSRTEQITLQLPLKIIRWDVMIISSHILPMIETHA